MPFSPTCKSNERVGPHGFQKYHHGRHIFGLTESYHVTSRRHIFHECKRNYYMCKNEVKSRAQEIGLFIQELEDSSLQEKS